VRAECLDWLLIVGRGHLEQVPRVYVEHDNTIGRTGRFALSRRTQLPDRPSSATITAHKSAGVTCSAVCSTSTDKLHERICAPYGSRGRLTAIQATPRSSNSVSAVLRRS
jgi:hypothetical protein